MLIASAYNTPQGKVSFACLSQKTLVVQRVNEKLMSHSSLLASAQE